MTQSWSNFIKNDIWSLQKAFAIDVSRCQSVIKFE